MTDEEQTDIEVIPATPTSLVPTEDEQLMALVAETLNETIPKLLVRIAKDSERSTDLYEELRELFLRGETDPEFLSQLNAANANIQTTTDHLIKVLDKLSRLKQGEARIQIANIQAESKDSGGAVKNIRAQLLDMIDEIE